ncbi:putative integral membrane protein [Babesia bovis T2Bo]|uniref:putative integral membrane protein n=1 Tax=Babesia bovis T2Bo TaxID=484906 RepID=UPI001D9A44E8|nr:putative integral membrane protein [Babesia bovis T2Bo]EDO05884.2 putative integral membrane protein [Babesia bovis T2Bo]
MAATTFVSCRGCNRFGVISKMIVSALALFYVASAIVYCGKIDDDDDIPRTVTLTPTAHSCPFGTLPVSKNAKRGNDKCAENKEQHLSNKRCPGKVCACGKSDIAQAEGSGLEKSASFMEVEDPIVIISDSVDEEATESNEGARPTAGKCIPREIESPDVRYERLV